MHFSFILCYLFFFFFFQAEDGIRDWSVTGVQTCALPIFALNDANIFENGILDAFNVTRGGGDAALFDRMLSGLNLGLGPVNGTTVTGRSEERRVGKECR